VFVGAVTVGGSAVVGISFGGISVGAFNPAVVLGAVVMGPFGWTALAYLLAELLAGVAAGLVFRALNPGDKLGRAFRPFETKPCSLRYRVV
jgi:aquaporin Z